MRFDDDLGNGKTNFAITANITDSSGTLASGCLHEEIAKYFPKLAYLIPYHLCSTDGPMHYIENTLYHAGNRDCHGLLKGETRQIVNGRTGQPCWIRDIHDDQNNPVDLPRYLDSHTQPTTTARVVYVPWCRVGEGKEREFDFARSSAIWPEATDEQLSLPKRDLKTLLEERLPALMERFKQAIISTGFIYEL